MKKKIHTLALSLAILLVTAFIGCSGDPGTGSSSGAGGVFNFFVQPVSDAIVATSDSTKATALQTIDKLSSYTANNELLFQPRYSRGTPTRDDIESRIGDFLNCFATTNEFPLADLASWLPLWYTGRVADDDFNLGQMGNFSLYFLTDIHCHGDVYLDLEKLEDVYDSDTEKKRKVDLWRVSQNTYGSYDDSYMTLAWGKSDDLYTGAIRIDAVLCAEESNSDLLADMFTSPEGEHPCLVIPVSDPDKKVNANKDIYNSSVQHSIYKEEEKDTENRFIQLITRYNNLVNYKVSDEKTVFCEYETVSLQQADRSGDTITLDSYAQITITENGSTDCSLVDDTLGNNNAVIKQWFHLEQNTEGTSVYYQCQNEGNYGYSKSGKTSVDAWSYYPGWCQNIVEPSGDYSYDSLVRVARFDISGDQISDTTVDSSYTFESFTDLDPSDIDDSYFTVDDVTVDNRLW